MPSSRERVVKLGVSSTTAFDSPQIGGPPFLNGGLHVDFGALQWSKMDENLEDRTRDILVSSADAPPVFALRALAVCSMVPGHAER